MLGDFRFACDGLLSRFQSDACGVGITVDEDKQPLTSVRGADVRGSYRHPPRIVPVLGKVAEYSVEAEGSVTGDVFQDRVARS